MEKLMAGARVRELREARGMNQVELARRLEISPSYLNQIERNQRPLSVAVLLRITASFGVDPEFFSTEDTARLVAELRDALLDEAAGVRISPTEITELASNQPSIARAFIALRRRYRDTVERTAALLGTHAITGDAGSLVSMPHEEVPDFFYDRHNYIAALDEAGERLAEELELHPGSARLTLAQHLEDEYEVRVAANLSDDGVLRTYEADVRVLRLSSQLRAGQQAFQLAVQIGFLGHDAVLSTLTDGGDFSGAEAVSLARVGLAHYFAAAVLMPYRAFHAAAEELRYDVDLLAERFGVSFEVVCHRLSTLQRPGLRGVPFAFVRVDRAGNMSKRQSVTGVHFSRAGGTCPLWNVYEAFTTPGRVLVQVTTMPDGRDFFWIARTVEHRPTGYGKPTKTFALGLGCELRHASRLVYSSGLDLDDRTIATPIGMGCKTCERRSCPQRAFPAVGSPLDVSEERSTVVPYPTRDAPDFANFASRE